MTNPVCYAVRGLSFLGALGSHQDRFEHGLLAVFECPSMKTAFKLKNCIVSGLKSFYIKKIQKK
nr:hypothetical protein [Comamonas testosteroni]